MRITVYKLLQEAQQKMNGYAVYMNYQFMHFGVKAEPAALLTVEVESDHDRGAFGLYRFPPGGIAPDDLLEEGDALVTYFGDRSRDVDVVLHPDLLFEGVRGRGRDDAARSGEYVVLQDLPVEIRFAQVEIHLLRDVVHMLERIDVREALLDEGFQRFCHVCYSRMIFTSPPSPKAMIAEAFFVGVPSKRGLTTKSTPSMISRAV